MTDDLLTARELAPRLSVSEWTVREQTRLGSTMVGLGLAAISPNTMQRAAAARPYRGSLRSRGLVVDVETRFWSKVDKSGECWTWTAGLDSHGYGRFHTGVQRSAHRVAWEFAVGRVPDGLWVLHACDNPPCVRPDHMFLGTARDTTADMIAKGRARGFGPVHAAKTRCPQGHGYTPANTYTLRGSRYCRTCHRLREAARRRAR